VLKKYFRYLFRYPESKFSGAVGRSQVHSRAKKNHKMLSKAPKIPNTKGHVAVVRNISSVTVNKLANPHKTRENARFFLC